MNPHLENAQMVRGKSGGNPWGLIETAALTRVIDGVALLRASGEWSEGDNGRLQTWFRAYLTWLQTSDLGRKENAAPNNHGTYYDLQAVTFALFIGDQGLAKQVLANVGPRRIAKHVTPDGSQPRELARTLSHHYTLLNTAGMVRLARLGEFAGVDVWNYSTDDGRGIRAALDWLIPFATGEKAWEHKQIKKPSWALLVPALRLAAIAYKSPLYERTIERLQGVPEAVLQTDLFYGEARFPK
jgi:hypothetical protein